MSLPNLPDPNHFFLKDICKRWKCDTGKLLQYCDSNMLEIGVILNDSLGNQTDQFGCPQQIALNGYYALSNNDVSGTLFWGDYPTDDYQCVVTTISVGSDVPDFILEGKEGQTSRKISLERKHVFTASFLVISKYERDRFEDEHDMQQPENTESFQENSTGNNITTQTQRELILKGWLGKHSLNESQPLEITQ
ncbi:MAG TPA: hypothetical protein EYN61_05110, partial [Chromatiaceae bacterium]|nr:hypothetical protein [Chromatiaceae bacterium]